MDPSDREDVEGGLRFLHVMEMQTKLDLADATARVLALTEELIARGVVSVRALEQRMDRVRTAEGERTADQATVQVAPTVDKYQATDLPDIDCASLIPLCKGRCCRLSFPLSFQDLDEQIVRFDYAMPYLIRQGSDGYCTHSDPARRSCGVYEARPVICRTYDCRKDARIWKDFANKVPAEDDAIPLVRIRKRPLATSGT
jgi:Fe-S-cluster containining protein